MANKVVETNEIYLNGTYYPLTRPVQSTLASIYPAKITIGDTTKDSQIRSSVISWSDWRGGIGVERMQGAADVDRAWYSTLNLRHRHHLVLSALANATTAETASGTAIDGEITFLAELGSTLYAGYGTVPYFYTNGNSKWERVQHGGSDYTFPGSPNDSLTTRMGGADNVVVAHEAGYSYFASSTTVTNVSYADDATKTTDGVKFIAYWDDRLWGIDSAGLLWYTLTLGGTKVDDAQLPVQSGYVTALFVGRDATGDLILYASTKTGLYAHDSANARWVETEFKLPLHEFNGSGTTRWRDAIYLPSGLGIYKYINGAQSAVITVTGPDKDDGLPEANRGTIKRLIGSHTELIAAVDATSAPATPAPAMAYQSGATAGMVGHSSPAIPDSSGTSSIVAWNDVGWQTLWSAPSAGQPITEMLVTSAGEGDYRLYWGWNGVVYHQMLPPDVINPTQLVNMEYETTGYIESPWFDASQSEVDKLALKLKVEVEDAGSNETVVVQYATDYTESYTSMGTITSDGTTTYDFGSSVGTTFRSIKFKLTLARESGSTAAIMKKSPDVVSLTLEYRKKLPAKYGHSVEVSLNQSYKGNNPKGLRANLISAIESNTLVEFTFRDDSGGTRNYYVDVVSATGIEYTGLDERGVSRISLVEP